jgi:hypothetical protein
MLVPLPGRVLTNAFKFKLNFKSLKRKVKKERIIKKGTV